MNNVHFAIPEIYGDSLSYYEVLRKLVDKVNDLIDNYNTVPEQIAEAVANLDASQLFSEVLNQLIHSIATDNTKSANAVKVYKKHDLLYATFNETVNLYESLIDFTTGAETELITGTNIREVNISELFIELRKLIDTNKNNIAAVTAVANENSTAITTIHDDITAIENKNTEQDNEISTLRTMISTPYNFKGDVASISALPASGAVNDTYYVQDVKYKVTWTGSAWGQSSLSEADYQTELSELKSDLTNSGTKRIYPNYTLGKYIYPWGGTSVRDNTGFKLSDPFEVKKGTKIIVKAKGIDNNVTIIAETNAEASSYDYLVNSIDDVYRDYEYIAPKDMYISVSGSLSSSYPIVITTIERYKVYDIDKTQVKNDIVAIGENVWKPSLLPNFDNAKLNRIYTISSVDVENIPVKEGGTLLCLGEDENYVIQMYSSFGSGLFYRQRRGASNGWSDWTQVVGGSMSLSDYASVAMFEKVGVVGDSYSSGSIWKSNTESRGTFYNLSWCQLMARRNGITVTNYSKGGLSTRTWLTDNMGLSKLNSSEKENLYILALGINDYYGLGMDYLGSISDIHDGNPSANADTFYGNYGRIVEAIKAKAPKAKIIMASIPTNESDLHKAFNEAILNIANHYSVPHIKLYNDAFIKSAYYHIIGGHPNAVGYSGMCKSYERLIEECMTLNFDYFNDYTSEV